MEIAEEKIIKVLSDIVNRLDDLEIEQQKNKTKDATKHQNSTTSKCEKINST